MTDYLCMTITTFSNRIIS